MRVRIAALVMCLVLPPCLEAGQSNGLLDISPDGRWLLACNNDNGTVTVIDVAKRAAVREVAVGAKPEGVTWIGNGPRAAVTCYRDGTVVFFDAMTGAVHKKLRVTAEPYGIVADAAGKRAWVTHEYPGTVSEIDLDAEQVLREIPAGAFVRGLAVRPAEGRIFVSEYYTGILRAIDLATGKEVDRWQGNTTDNLSRHVQLHPSRPKAYLAHIRSMVHVNHGAGSIFPQLSIIDLKPGPDKRRLSFAMDTFNGVYVTTNAWESALSPDGKHLYVVYAGTNDANHCTVIDDDYQEMAPVGLPRRVGQNPRAVRVSPDSKTVFIYNAMDFAVTVHDVNLRQLAKITTCKPPKTPEWVRGKVLFNTALPPLSRRRWVACSSCHPDGHHDARVWQNPEGKRKTTALFGVAHTHPLHYSGDRDEVQDFEYTIRSQLMQGRGLLAGSLKRKVGYGKIELEQTTGGRSTDLDALAIYTNSFEFPLSPHLVAPGKLTAAAERGKAIFHRKDVGCATCHSGPYYSDSTLTKPYRLHDVGTGNDDPTEKMGPAYDTPTLLGVYRTAPYLHHGKAKTLREVLTTCNKDDRHGKTSQLAAAELDDLLAFIKALPYETPPDATPNSVKYRLTAKPQAEGAMNAEWRNRYETAITAAEQAGRLALQYFDRDIAVEWKSDHSPVTLADREAEALLRTTLLDRFPGDGFLGEESGETLSATGYRWIIDPIDGTRSFVRGIPLWGTLVGLEYRGEPIAGVCRVPALQQTFRALRGDGAFRDERRLHVSAVDTLAKAHLYYSSISWFKQAGVDRQFLALVDATERQRGFGDFYGFVMVAQGSGEAMLEYGVHPWDIAALVPIIEEAGGRLTAWDDTHDLNRLDVLASNGRLHATLLQALRK